MFGKVVVAAFAGFQLLVTRTRAVAVWAAASILIGLATAAIMAALVLPGGGALVLPAGGAGAAVAPWRWILVVAVAAPLLVFNLCAVCAINRAILRPSAQAAAYLRLGADEVRMFVVGVLLFLVVLVLWLVGVVGFNLMKIFGFPLILAGLVPLGLALFALPRLALAGAVSFARRSIDFSEAWDLGGQRYWSLLVMCLLVGFIALGLALVQFLLSRALPTAGAPVLERLIFMLPNAAVAWLLSLVVNACAPAAFLALKARPMDQAAAFD